MHSLFGVDMPFALQFFLVFVIVLGLIGVGLWGLRWFSMGGLGGSGARGRQPRLGVIDHAGVDGRRRLILVRRDNVEHLLMIGGPTDVVVETNIVRAVAAPRDVGSARPAALDTLPRAIPLPENGGSWPLQPEPAAPQPASRAVPKAEPRTEPAADEAPAWPLQPHAETASPPPAPARPQRQQRDTLAALADELSAPPTQPTPPAPPQPRSRQSAAAPRPPLEPRVEPRAEPRPEPRAAAPQPAPAAEAAAADQSLAEMAHRLEAALRKPNTSAEARAPAASAPAPEPAAPPAPPSPRAARTPPAEPKPARNAAPTKPPQTTLYDNLEQEMASLLGRPTNKS
jgi:hypothetical protein